MSDAPMAVARCWIRTRPAVVAVEALEGRAAVAVVADVAKFVAAPEAVAEPVWSVPLVEELAEHSAPAWYMTVRGDFSG